MKKTLLTTAVLLLCLAVFAVAGCGASNTTTTMASTQTTMASTQTTMAVIEVPSAMAGSYVDVTPEQVVALMESALDLVIIDVSPEYDSGHLPGAVNYYGGDGTLAAAIPTLDPEVTYLVYCHSESASRAGAQALVDAGFTKVYRLAGEYDAWTAMGYPVEM